MGPKPVPFPSPELWGDTTLQTLLRGWGVGLREPPLLGSLPPPPPQAVGFRSIPSFAKVSKRTELVPCPGLVTERNRRPRTCGK